MSLRDTIEGARREAEGNVVGRPKKEVEAVTGASEGERRGFSRSSSAHAKPARDAAASVRTESKSATSSSGGLFGGPAGETKEQKRERKRREREEQNLRSRTYEAVLRTMPGFRKTERVFWILVGAGFALAVVSLVSVWVFGEPTDTSSPTSIVSTTALVAAYAFIIAGIIYDFARRRPFRKQAQARVDNLSEKKLLEVYERERAAAEGERAARASRKATRKSKKTEK